MRCPLVKGLSVPPLPIHWMSWIMHRRFELVVLNLNQDPPDQSTPHLSTVLQFLGASSRICKHTCSTGRDWTARTLAIEDVVPIWQEPSSYVWPHMLHALPPRIRTGCTPHAACAASPAGALTWNS